MNHHGNCGGVCSETSCSQVRPGGPVASVTHLIAGEPHTHRRGREGMKEVEGNNDAKVYTNVQYIQSLRVTVCV